MKQSELLELVFVEIETSLVTFHQKTEYYYKLLLVLDKIRSETAELPDFINNYENLSSFIKFNFLICRSSFDLCVVLKHLTLASSELERYYFEKNAILHVYELVEAIESAKPGLRKILIQQQETTEKFNSLGKELSTFKKRFKYEKNIATIRNKIAAHYNNDIETYMQVCKGDCFKELYEIIETINPIAYNFLFLIHDTLQSDFNLLKEMMQKYKIG